MEQNRKHLKISSAIVLLFAAVTFLRVAGEFLFSDLGTAMLPDGTSESLELIARLLLVTVTLVFLLPQIFVGVRGLRIAKKPSGTRGHIVWAYILVVFTIFGLFDTIIAIAQGKLASNAYALVNGLLSTAVYIYYIKYASAIAKSNQ